MMETDTPRTEIEFWIDYFERSRAVPGGGEIFCAGHADPLNQAAGAAVAIALAKSAATNWPLYKEIVVIFPPDRRHKSAEDVSREFFSKAVEYVKQDAAESGTEVDLNRLETGLRQRIKIRLAKTQELSELVEFVCSLDRLTALFLMNAEIYSNNSAVTPRSDDVRSEEGGRAKLEEDLWVPNVYHAASELIRLAESRDLFIMLSVQKFGPVRVENTKLLESVKHCGIANVVLLGEELKADEAVLTNANTWVALAREQRVDEVMEQIDSTDLSPIQRAFFKAQCLMAAGRYLLSFQIIEPFIERIRERGLVQVVLSTANIATRAGRYDIALSLLQAAIQNTPITELDLKAALDLARRLGATEEEKSITDLLNRLYPNSITSVRQNFQTSRSAGDFARLADQLEREFGPEIETREIHYIYLLARAFSVDHTPDYDNLIQSIAVVLPEYKDRATVTCATHALQRGLFALVVRLCLSHNWPLQAQDDAAWLMVHALEGLFLRKDQGPAEPEGGEAQGLIHQCLIFTLDHLSKHPDDGDIRSALYRAQSPEISGLYGISNLSLIVASSSPPKLVKNDKVFPSGELLPGNERTQLLENVWSNLPKPILLGAGRLPPVDPTISLEGFLKTVVNELGDISTKIVDEDDVKLVYLLLHVVILISREIEAEEYVPSIMALAAAGLAASGHFQSARNFAEVCLQQSSQSTSRHKREAWLAYSDIYLRCHNPLEALMGLGCALQCSVESITHVNRYHELVLMFRLFRELRLFPLAKPLVPLAKEQAAHLDNSEQAIARLEYLEVGLEFQMITSNSDEVSEADQIAALRLLMKRVVALNARERELAEQVLPTVLLLAQVSGLLLSYGQEIEVEAQQELDDTLALLEEPHLQLVQALAGVSTSAKSIEVLSAALSKTRYSEDFGTDTKFITILARRGLLTAAQSGDPVQTVFLVEWLADLTTNNVETDEFNSSDRVEVADNALRGYTELLINKSTSLADHGELDLLRELAQGTDPTDRLQHARYPTSAEDLTKFGQQCSDDELDLHSIGLAEDGSLVRVSFELGTSSMAIEPRNVFDSGAYRKWKEVYPYAYRDLKLGDPFLVLDEMKGSLAKIGIAPKSSERPLVLIPEVRLQSIPPNLMLVNGNMPGLDRPAAMIPSLTWLKGIRATQYQPSDLRNAWIPASNLPGDHLFKLHNLLKPTLTEHGFAISRDPLMPTDIGGSDVVIVGAHGGLQEEKEWFRVVADERSTRLSARDVAAKLRRSGLVILFVCSGGRVDRHPYSSTGVGLVHLLLAYGCRAVIASPWPIIVGVAAHWLPAFMESFAAGESAVTANYVANNAVAVEFPHPQFSLAMNVYGDPLLRVCVKGVEGGNFDKEAQ